MATIREVVEGALKKIEEVGEGQSMSAEQGADGLQSLVDLLDSWSIEAGMVSTETSETFTLTGNDNSYTIGTGGDFNTVRPTRIRYITINDGTVTSLQPIGAKEYAEMYDSDDVGAPEYFYYDGNSPLGTIKFYPTPAQAYTIAIYSEKPLTTYTNLADTLVAPTGWPRMLKYNLAVEVAPEYGKQPSSVVVSVAMESKRLCKISNLRNDYVTSTCDTALVGGGGYNIYSGDV